MVVGIVRFVRVADCISGIAIGVTKPAVANVRKNYKRGRSRRGCCHQLATRYWWCIENRGIVRCMGLGRRYGKTRRRLPRWRRFTVVKWCRRRCICTFRSCWNYWVRTTGLRSLPVWCGLIRICARSRIVSCIRGGDDGGREAIRTGFVGDSARSE